MQNVKSLIYSVILVFTCVFALITFGLWPMDAASVHSKALRRQITQSSEEISAAINIISTPKVDGRAVEQQKSPLQLLKKTRSDMAAAIRDNNQAVKTDLTIANQILCRIDTSLGYFYQKNINGSSRKLTAMTGELEKDIAKIKNLQSILRHLVSLQDISDQPITAALNKDMKEIYQRKATVDQLKKQIADLQQQREEFEKTASQHLEKSSRIREEIMADASLQAQKKLETAIAEKTAAGKAIDKANDILLKIDQIKGQVKINSTMLATAQERAESEKQELAKRKLLRSKLAGRLGSVRQEIAVVNEKIAGSCNAIADICREMLDAKSLAVASFNDSFKAANAAKRTAGKKQKADALATQGNAYTSSVAMLMELSSAIVKVQLIIPKLSVISPDQQPKSIDTIKAFVASTPTLQTDVADNLEKAASAYNQAARTKSDEKWKYKIQEYQVRMERFRLTGQNEDKEAADGLLKTLEGLKDTNVEVKKFLNTLVK